MTDPLNLLSSLPGLLIFKIGVKEFCMDVKFVQTILKGANKLKIHGPAKHGILGLIKYSEADYNVIDSMMYFGASAERKGISIILCSIFGKRLGIIVDEIVEFISLDELFIEENIDFKVYGQDKYVSWYLDYQERKIFYPNYEKIVKELSTTDFLLSMVL